MLGDTPPAYSAALQWLLGLAGKYGGEEHPERTLRELLEGIPDDDLRPTAIALLDVVEAGHELDTLPPLRRTRRERREAMRQWRRRQRAASN